MGLFKTNPEKQAKKEQAKQHRLALQAAGRTKGVMINYIGGHPNVEANSLIGISQGIEKNTLNLNGNLITVTAIEWDEKGQRSAGKAAAGAIIGGALTGGVGLIAGAAIGGKQKDNSVAIVTCTDGVIEYIVYLRADAEKYQKLVEML
ncbi:hypothetical protein D3C75_541260 [compost metagenome]